LNVVVIQMARRFTLAGLFHAIRSYRERLTRSPQVSAWIVMIEPIAIHLTAANDKAD